MLRSLARPAAARLAPSCPACRAALSTSRFASTSALRLPPLPRASRAASIGATRARTTTRQLSTATSPLAEEREDAQAEDEQQPSTEPLTEQEEMDALLATFESTLDPAPIEVQEPPTPPTRPSPPPLSPSMLLSPNLPAGPPTASDLRAFAPRHFTIPTPLSPDSHRLIYSKTFNSVFVRLERAFTKAQLLSLVSTSKKDGGLGIDLMEEGADRERWKKNVKGKKSKYWTPKKWEQMTKRELTHVVMVLHWGMDNPDTLPSGKKGPQKVDAVPLDDKTLFLLLSPHSTIIPSLSSTLGVSYSFSRNPTNGILSLILRGNVSSVEKAKAEIEGVVDTAYQRTLHLPRSATTLRPEVYQAVSRVAKAFLEPSKNAEEGEDDVLIATAAEQKYLERAEQYLLTAFTLDHHRLSTPLFASLPTSLTTQSYSMYPFQPPFRPAFLQGGSTSSYARIRAIASPPSSSEPTPTPFEDLLSWSTKMGVQAMERVPLGRGGKDAGGLRGFERVTSGRSSEKEVRWGAAAGEMETVMGALQSGFARGEKFALPAAPSAEGAEQPTTEEWDLRASFGHVLWPLFPRGGAGGEGLGPVLEGEWGLEKLLEWRGRKGASARAVWCGSAPANFLASTGVLTPTTPLSTPFSALLPPSAASSPLDEAQRIASDSPLLDNVQFRRVTYLPVELPSEAETGKAMTRVEINFARGQVVSRMMEVTEMKVEVVVPSGASDVQFTLTKRKDLHESAMPDFPTTHSASTVVPLHIAINSQPYILSTDHWIRRTTIDTPAPSTEAGAEVQPTPTSSPILPTRQVQETFHDRVSQEGSRGIEVSLYLGGTSKLAALPSSSAQAPSFLSAEGEAEREPDARDLHDLVRSGKWKKMLEALERKACEVRERTIGAAMAGGKGVEGRVFGAGR